MVYINVGACVDGERPRTKKALREALANAPDTVTFDGTSMFDSKKLDSASAYDGSSGRYRAQDIPPGIVLTVVGPDPFISRKWYASVTRDSDGKVKIK